jgi:MoxR-like ATPase
MGLTTGIAIDPRIKKLQDSIETVIKGKFDVVKLAIVGLLANGHILLEDVPGVGKTTLARALSRSLGCSFQRIQFTSDLLPSDIIGVNIFNQKSSQFEFKSGPVFSNIVLADEINRTTPKTQSALLEAMSEGKVTVENVTYQLPQPFLVIATQNPVEHHGTYPLPESQLDRFLMRLRVGYPDLAVEKQIIRAMTDSCSTDNILPVMAGDEVIDAQTRVKLVKVDDALLEYLMAIVTETRRSEFLAVGVSPRGAIALFHAAQALAYVEGRDYCLPDDIKRLVIPVFAHRLVVSSKYSSPLKRSEEAEAILTDILKNIEVPL